VTVGCAGLLEQPEIAATNAVVADKRTAKRKAQDPDFPLEGKEALLLIVGCLEVQRDYITAEHHLCNKI
jgi:hypothetical protein